MFSSDPKKKKEKMKRCGEKYIKDFIDMCYNNYYCD